jgi:curved DNA-binding protein CbpA
MQEQTYYQILGVRPEASQSVIDAAYQRHMRRYETESVLTRKRTGNDFVFDEENLGRIQEAYAILKDPALRKRYDEKLTERRADLESIDLSRRAQQHLAESGAWLSEQRHEEDKVIFRIGWAADFTEVKRALEDRIPKDSRHFKKGEWQIDAGYSKVLVDLFGNYESPDLPPPPRMPLPIYQPHPYKPVRQRVREMWDGWPFLIMAGLVVAIVLTMIFPANSPRQASASATATAVALFELSQQVDAGVFPTPTPEFFEAWMLPASLRHPSVNLRAGPDIDYASLGFLFENERYWVVGRTADSTWLVVMTEDMVGWSAEWTLSVEGDLMQLPVYVAGAQLPDLLPFPPPEPESS